MAGIRNDMQVGFRPGTMKIPGTRQGTYHIITPLHNDTGYSGQRPGAFFSAAHRFAGAARCAASGAREASILPHQPHIDLALDKTPFFRRT